MIWISFLFVIQSQTFSVFIRFRLAYSFEIQNKLFHFYRNELLTLIRDNWQRVFAMHKKIDYRIEKAGNNWKRANWKSRKFFNRQLQLDSITIFRTSGNSLTAGSLIGAHFVAQKGKTISLPRCLFSVLLTFRKTTIKCSRSERKKSGKRTNDEGREKLLIMT